VQCFSIPQLVSSSCENLYRKTHDSCIFVFLNFLLVCTFQVATRVFLNIILNLSIVSHVLMQHHVSLGM